MERNDRLEIDLTDLFLWLMKYWYLFLLLSLMGAFLGGAYASHRNTAADSTDINVQITEVRALLTPREISDVNSIVEKLNLSKEKMNELSNEMTETGNDSDKLEASINLADYWRNVYNQQVTLANGLDKNPIKYYQLLTADPDKKPEHDSIAKYAVIGAAAFFILTVLCLCAVYGTSATVKTPGELCSAYELPVLMDFSGKKNNESMLATDISILMANASLTKLAILCDNSNEGEKAKAKVLAESLGTKSSDVKVSVVSPLSSPEELINLSDCDSVVSLVTIKKTLRPDLQEALSYCDRYGCNILGFVTIGSKA